VTIVIQGGGVAVASQNSPWATAARFTEAVKEALMRRISIPMDVAVLVLGRSPGPNYSLPKY